MKKVLAYIIVFTMLLGSLSSLSGCDRKTKKEEFWSFTKEDSEDMYEMTGTFGVKDDGSFTFTFTGNVPFLKADLEKEQCLLLDYTQLLLAKESVENETGILSYDDLKKCAVEVDRIETEENKNGAVVITKEKSSGILCLLIHKDATELSRYVIVLPDLSEAYSAYVDTSLMEYQEEYVQRENLPLDA